MVAGHGRPTGRPADPTPAPQRPKTATGGTRQLPPARRHQPALREVRERAGGEPDRGGGGEGGQAAYDQWTWPTTPSLPSMLCQALNA